MILPQRLVLEKESTKTKSTREKGKEIPSKNETSQIKSKSKGSPKGNTKGKRGNSTQSNKTDGKGPKKRGIPRQDREEEYRERWKKNTGNSGTKGKNHDGKSGGKAKKGQK